jgi:hypothetical protein
MRPPRADLPRTRSPSREVIGVFVASRLTRDTQVASLSKVVDGSGFEASIRDRVGLMDGPRFRSAVRSALAMLAGHPGLPLERMAAVLPPDLVAGLHEAELEALDPASTYLRVAEAARIHVGVAIQVVRAVLSELASRLGAEGRAELRGVLPREWSELVVDPAPVAPGE